MAVRRLTRLLADWSLRNVAGGKFTGLIARIDFQKGRALPKTINRLPRRPANHRPSNHGFLCLEYLLAHYARTTPGRKAIVAAERAPLTYRALWELTKETVRALRSLGVSRGDRVAVVLPTGPAGAAAMIAVPAGAVCVPLNPAFTADEWQLYLGDLRVT